MKGNPITFFATKEDLIPILQTVENESEIKYVQFGRSDCREPKTYLAATLLPDLGIASNESAINCKTYLICDRHQMIQAREAAQGYIFDQLINPETLTFTAGGFWGRDILLHGRFASASDSPFASRLLKCIRAVVRKQFKKIRAFDVGREAEQLLDAGKRLTIAAQSPESFDLRR